jgi:NTP pyrophosphatase (non-canonical NTP hydrolase)
VNDLHVQEFQEMMHRIYFHRDSQRGKIGTYKWLMDEMRELDEALKENDRKALEAEFADVFAWLASLANVVNVDLEKAAMTKYNNRCPRCLKTLCECSS